MTPLRAVLALGLLFLLGACSSGADTALPPTQTLVPSTSTPIPAPTEPQETVTPLPGPAEIMATRPAEALVTEVQQLVGQAVLDLAARLDISADAITVYGVEAGTWDIAACDGEQPGDAVAEYRIVLNHQDAVYTYYAASPDEVIECTTSEADTEGEPVILDTNLIGVIDIAQRSLAERLDLPVRRIFLVEAYPVVWEDSSLGCEGAEQPVLATPVAGYRIVLRAGEKQYVYHTNYRQAILCAEETVRQSASATPAQ